MPDPAPSAPYLPSFIHASLALLDERQRCPLLSPEEAARTAALAGRVARHLHWLFDHGLAGYEPQPLANRPPRPIFAYRRLRPHLLTLGPPTRIVPAPARTTLYWPACIALVEEEDWSDFMAEHPFYCNSARGEANQAGHA